MLDLSHIPNSQQDVQIFYAISGSNSWQTWQKPRKCNYVWIMCIGGAGGGGGAFAQANQAYSNGGGSGGVLRALYNAQQLPDTLYVQVGLGGVGGAPTLPGSSGTRSWVALQPAVVAQNLVAGSGAAVAAGGQGSGVGTNAAGETAATQATATFFTLSNFISTAGNTAASAGGLIPLDKIPFTSQIVTSGVGGGSWDLGTATRYNGASILSSSISPLIEGGLAAPTSQSNATNGADGITSWKPFYSLGGAGGGSAISGSGGKGGNGGIGSGGGGGGMCATTYTPGSGGKGGDGIVFIISF